MFPDVDRFVSQLDWLDSIGDPLQKFVKAFFADRGDQGKRIKDVLNGAWLGHPLHPVITDVPVGAWTTSLVLDVAGLDSAADVAIGTGLVAAVGAALTGWTDWSDTYGQDRKVGLLHGLTMGATTGLYALSLMARGSGWRRTGMLLSNLGLASLTAGAYLGGDEVFDRGYGVNHTAFQQGPSEYTQVMRESDLKDGKPTKVDAASVPVVLVKRGSEIYALADVCVHAGCSLSGGKIEDDTIICPCHGSQYRLVDGAVVHGPATRPEPYYDVRVENGMIEVKVGGD